MIIVQMVMPILYVIIGIVVTDMPQHITTEVDPISISSAMYEGFDNRISQVYTYSNHTGKAARTGKYLLNYPAILLRVGVVLFHPSFNRDFFITLRGSFERHQQRN